MSDNLHYAEVLKVDTDLGLVFGFAIVSKIDGEPHFDRQGDHIPEDAMLEASTDFAKQNRRPAKEMHDTEVGDVVHTFPLTTEIAQSLGIVTKRTGLLIAMSPGEEALGKFATGEYTGFSIGGARDPRGDEVVE